MAVNIPSGHKIFQHFPFQGPPKYTQIGIFCMTNTIWQPRMKTEFRFKEKEVKLCTYIGLSKMWSCGSLLSRTL
jgi:hypothetical protein